MASTPTWRDRIEITVKREDHGLVSRWLHDEVRLGDAVVFQTSETTAPVPVGATILDVADEAGVFIDNACRSGTCGSCRVKLVSGSVRMEVADALTDGDKAVGYILACQATIGSDVTVEA